MTDRLSRRSFLHYGATAVTGSVMVRAVGAEYAAPLPVHTDFELEEATVAQLQDSMRTGARTSRSICVAYLARIAQLDPQLHSVLETNPDALAIADRLDAERKANRVRGPLHGIPVLVKDNIATGDRMMTTAGSLALAGVTPPRDAPLVARLRVPRGGGEGGGWTPAGLRGTRIGVARKKFFGYSPETDALVEAAIDVLRREGAVIVAPADIPHAGEYDDSELLVLLYELKADLASYLAAWAPGARVKTLADVIAFNEANKATEMPYFGQELFVQAQEKGPLTDQAYRDALAKDQRLSRTEGLDVVFAQNTLDAIVAPTGSPPWPTDLVNGDHFLGASSTPAAVAGYPSVCVPVGYSFGLPVGMSLIGRASSESTLLKLAYAYEQAAKPRRPPRFLATAELG